MKGKNLAESHAHSFGPPSWNGINSGAKFVPLRQLSNVANDDHLDLQLIHPQLITGFLPILNQESRNPLEREKRNQKTKEEYKRLRPSYMLFSGHHFKDAKAASPSSNSSRQ